MSTASRTLGALCISLLVTLALRAQTNPAPPSPAPAATDQKAAAKPPATPAPAAPATPPAGAAAAEAKPAAAPGITGIYPETGYPVEGRYAFDIYGEGFDPLLDGYDLIVDGAKIGIATAGDKKDCPVGAKPCLRYVGPHQLRLSGYAARDYQGSVRVQLDTPKGATPEKIITFSQITPNGARMIALGVFLALSLIFLGAVWSGVGPQRIGGVLHSPWTVLFLDRDTNTYSLAKFQLLVWNAAMVFGYVYLGVCRMLIQWRLELPSLPEGLPTLAALSLGTSIGSIGITASKGNKGSGSIRPSFADFVTSGGLVAGDRFQYFVWTVVGVFGFLAMVLRSNPATFAELPKLPDNFLYMMGISGAGYLGGKLVRSPGPNIKTAEVLATGFPTTISFHLTGEWLERAALFRVDDEVVTPSAVNTTVVKASTAANDPDMAMELNVTLDFPKAVEGAHRLRLINRDGQASDLAYNGLPAMTVNPPAKPAAVVTPGQSGVVVLAGTNFRAGMKAVWKDPARADQADVRVDVTVDSATQASVPVQVDRHGTWQLTLISASGYQVGPLAVEL